MFAGANITGYLLPISAKSRKGLNINGDLSQQ
jgi:hypothetical protein